MHIFQLEENQIDVRRLRKSLFHRDERLLGFKNVKAPGFRLFREFSDWDRSLSVA